MQKILLLMAFLFCSVSNALYTPSQVEELVMSNSVGLTQGTKFNTTGKLTDHMISVEKMRHSNFKPSMWYYHSFIAQDVMYVVFYDYTVPACYTTYFDLVEMNKKTTSKTVTDEFGRSKKIKVISGKDVTQLKEVGGKIIDSNRKEIKRAVCQKLYNF